MQHANHAGVVRRGGQWPEKPCLSKLVYKVFHKVHYGNYLHIA